MRTTLFNIAFFTQLLSLVTGEVYYAKVHRNGNEELGCTILDRSDKAIYKSLNSEDKNAIKVLTKLAATPAADSQVPIKDASTIVEIFSASKNAVDAHIGSICTKTKEVEAPVVNSRSSNDNIEVRKIVDNGDPSNRIDVVFMGDGYTASERSKFFSDIGRLTKDMFEGPTFKSWLPVFNIWAIHVDSVESGIGYNGAKNTPFKLYRDAGQLRGIFPGNEEYAREVCKMTGANACDYPSLIGNDDYYGGLGGEFVISTRSERTGTVVLRHEMGHNFVDVGEEYDNGQVYSGVNAATTINTGWKNWLSGPVREERAIYRLLEYPWHDLSKGEKSFNFTSDGKYSRWYLLTSVTAAGQADSLEFVLDGKVLPWASRGSDDREFYDWRGPGFSAGTHTFTVRAKKASTNPDIPRMFASVTLHEFGNEREFKMSNDYYSAYPTWDVDRRKTYRPTNAGCLMRNMTHNSFCKVCKEGMWYQFLQRISLIDGVDVTSRKITLRTLKLGQFRTDGIRIPGERLSITWSRNGRVQPFYKDQLEIYYPAKGNWSVTVKFTTSEIKSDPSNLTKDTKTFTV